MSHPDSNELAAFGSGDLDSTAAERIREHLLHCPPCRQRAGSDGTPDLASLSTVGSGATTHDGPGVLKEGDRVGPFLIRRRIAEGAFGVVYLARQSRPVRRERVALKMIKPGMDSQQVLARFETERQALALMEHPNIAMVFDAGTAPDGRPYFVMEYVPGVPLTQHCHENRVPIEGRLELFRQICDAVQHAHQKGVIHRDLKPSNILVTGGETPTPKIIDFGVAKALDRSLTDRTLETGTNQIIGTPAYMAPEQARTTEQGTDTRADIYSLGVLLYELLTETLPFDFRQAGLDEMQRIIRDVDPERPSHRISTASSSDSAKEVARNLGDLRTLERKVRDELDWVTMKCLEKDPSRRYPTAQSLGDEIERFLNDQPVQARPPGLVYRTRKFVRRNRQLVAASLIVALISVAGATTAVSLAILRAVEQGKRIAAETELARHEAGGLLDEARAIVFDFADQSRRMAETALVMRPDFLDAEIFLAYHAVYHDRPDEAEDRVRRILAEREAPEAAAILASLVRKRDPAEADHLEGIARKGLRKDRLYYYLAMGTAEYADALDLIERSLEENPWYFDAKWYESRLHYKLGDYETMREIARLLVKVRPGFHLAWIERGTAEWWLGNDSEAISSFTKAIDLNQSDWLGYYDRGLVSYFGENYEAALQDFDRAAERNADQGDAHGMKADTLWQILQAGSVNEADPVLSEIVELMTRAYELGSDEAWVLHRRARAQLNMREYEAGEADLSRVVELLGEDPGILEQRGVARLWLRRFQAARDDLERVVELAPGTQTAAEADFSIGMSHLLEGQRERARSHFERAAEFGDAGNWRIGPAIVSWLDGRWDAAIAGLASEAEVEKQEWMHLWVWELHQRNGDPLGAESSLAAAEAAAGDEIASLVAAVRHIRGEATEQELLDRARIDRTELEAFFVLASKAVTEGRLSDARKWWSRCVDLGRPDNLEHDLCELRVEATR